MLQSTRSTRSRGSQSAASIVTGIGTKRWLWSMGVVAEIVLFLGLWEIAISILGFGNPRLMPPPSAMWDALLFILQRGWLQASLVYSLKNLAVGYFLAAISGVGLGLVMGTSKVADRLAGPSFWMLYSLPRLALQPLLVLWMGYGMMPKVLIIWLLSVFPIAINVMDGARTVDVSLRRVGLVFGLRGWQMHWKITIPAAFPFILSGLRMGLSRAMVGVVVGEFIGGSKGVGFMIQRASAQFEVAEALVLTILIVLLANLGMAVLEFAKRTLTPWHASEFVAR